MHHIICECSNLAQKEYKRRHDNVERIVHWEICKKYYLPRAEQWYNHKPKGVTENDSIKVLWDFNINADYEIKHRRSDIVIELKSEKTVLDHRHSRAKRYKDKTEGTRENRKISRPEKRNCKVMVPSKRKRHPNYSWSIGLCRQRSRAVGT